MTSAWAGQSLYNEKDGESPKLRMVKTFPDPVGNRVST